MDITEIELWICGNTVIRHRRRHAGWNQFPASRHREALHCLSALGGNMSVAIPGPSHTCLGSIGSSLWLTQGGAVPELPAATPSLTSKAPCTATWHIEVVPGYGGQRVDIDFHPFAYDVATLWRIALLLDGLSDIIKFLYPQRVYLQQILYTFTTC